MRRSFLTIAALVGASALTISAQTPQPQQPPAAPGAAAQRAAADQVITITGCLKEDKEGAMPEIRLTDAKMAASSAVAGIGVAPTYQVAGLAEAELKKHLNHQVELTGKIAPAAPTATDKTPDFQATSLKMVAATCGAPK